MRFGLQLGPKSAPKTAPGSYPNQLQSKARKSAQICTTPKQNAYFCPPEGTQNGPQRAPRSLRNATETTTPKRDQKGTQNSPTWAPKSAPKPLLNGPERAPKTIRFSPTTENLSTTPKQPLWGPPRSRGISSGGVDERTLAPRGPPGRGKRGGAQGKQAKCQILTRPGPMARRNCWAQKFKMLGFRA